MRRCPKCPDTGHLSDLQSLAGNEQLIGILDRYDELVANLNDWTKASDLAAERLPAFQHLQALARHADGLSATEDAASQIEAIIADRRLLETSDPVPSLAAQLTDALRTALTRSQERYDKTYDSEWQRTWKTPKAGGRSNRRSATRYSSRLNITKVSKGATGTEQEVLDSLERISLDGWRTRIAALPQLFAEARAEADKIVEPKTRHVKLGNVTLRTPADVKTWIEKMEQELLKQVEQGPIVIG